MPGRTNVDARGLRHPSGPTDAEWALPVTVDPLRGSTRPANHCGCPRMVEVRAGLNAISRRF